MFRYELDQTSGDQEQQSMSTQSESFNLQINCIPINEQFSSQNEQESFEQIINNNCKSLNQKQKNEDNTNQEKSYELLSKAFVNAVCDCTLQKKQHKSRDRSTASLLGNSQSNDITDVKMSNRDDDINNKLNNLSEYKIFNKKFPSMSQLFDKSLLNENKDFQNINTPIVKRRSFSAISSQSFNTIIPKNKSTLSLNYESKLQKSDQINLKKQQCSKSSINFISKNDNLNCFTSDYKFYNSNGKLYRNTSCSPIKFDLIQNKNKIDLLPTLSIVSNNFNEQPKICKPNPIHNFIFQSILPSISSFYTKNTSQNKNLNLENNKFSSTSFFDYNQPKIGEPGRPGTCDLNQSIKRLNILKKVFFLIFILIIII